MSKSNQGSRVGRRAGTKSAQHLACQRATKGVLRRARKAANRPANKRERAPRLIAFAVRNVGTKKEVTVLARDGAHAVEIAMSEHKLAKVAERLRVAAVHADLAP